MSFRGLEGKPGPRSTADPPPWPGDGPDPPGLPVEARDRQLVDRLVEDARERAEGEDRALLARRLRVLRAEGQVADAVVGLLKWSVLGVALGLPLGLVLTAATR